MILYAESSAVLSWLFGEPPGDEVLQLLASATRMFASELTLLECQRAIHQAEAAGRLSARRAEAARSRLEAATRSWNVYRFGAVIVDRASRPFPREPLRTLDALHLATALHVAEFEPDLTVLSFDRRIRSNAAALGLHVAPVEGET
ncbi:MAG: type II toxin-antitoxin system VapC family toxin [Holophagales bacterium]|nr:type II toxin-antitoxin system VapC family toxin [Holophagales bacterium]MYH25513.1 type II toxin-antitoxin system VapC family toxin [Holophagales bacterium]